MSKRRRRVMQMWRRDRKAMAEHDISMKNWARANMAHDKDLEAWAQAKGLQPDPE